MKKVMGSHYLVRFPFKCKPNIEKWKVLYFNNKNKQLCSEVFGIHKLSVLSIKLIKIQELD